MPASFMEKSAQAIIGVVDAHLLLKNKRENRGYEKYHPSAFGNCLRLMQYQRYAERGYVQPQPETFEPHVLRIFGNGHSIHDRWRDYFDEIGVLRGYWKCQNEKCRKMHGSDQLQGCFRPPACDQCDGKRFEYHELNVVSSELNFAGHADMILDFSTFDAEKYVSVNKSLIIGDLPNKPVVVDMKSIKNYDFQEAAKGKPHEYYCTQLMIYANLLDCAYGVLIYENKDNQRTTCFRVDRHDDTLFALVKRQAADMNAMVEVVDENGNVHHLLPPPRPLSKDSKACKYCSYQAMCHNSNVWDNPELKHIRSEFYGELLTEYD